MVVLRLPASTANALAARAGVTVSDPVPRKTRIPTPDWVAGLQTQLRALGLPIGVRELRFHSARKWRFDLAIREARLAIEIEGGAFVQGRHARGAGYAADCHKYAEAMVLGWRVLRVVPAQVRTGEAVKWVSQILGREIQVVASKRGRRRTDSGNLSKKPKGAGSGQGQ